LYIAVPNGKYKATVVSYTAVSHTLQLKFRIDVYGMVVSAEGRIESHCYPRNITLDVQPNLAVTETQRYIKAILNLKVGDDLFNVVELHCDALIGKDCEITVYDEQVVNVRPWESSWEA
jgi:hypothetical protein